MSLWEQVQRWLSHRLSTEAYQNWISLVTEEGVEGDSLVVSVPNDLVKEWLETEYRHLIEAAIEQLRLPIGRIVYKIRPSAPEPSPTRNHNLERELNGEFRFASSASQLNRNFSFENFVVGSCNQFAHAAAWAVATKPSSSYNPLFIYGGVGMGKTHLMHAIGLHLITLHGGMRVVYTSSERFMNEMITCIKTERMSQFQRHYRTADVLLIDDIQVIAGKERTQEEFFHTFNELYDHQKQIVISSDCPPKNIPGLVERLRSRFEWGLMADIQPPDLETKMAILDKKAEAKGVKLPEDVRILLATKVKPSVRELEGALIKLIAYSSLTGAPVNLTMAQQLLRQLGQGTERKATIDSIVRAVAEHFGLHPSQLKQKTNAHHISYPRQIAMFLAKELTHASLPEIGRCFGGKHHTTVLHSINKIERLRATDPDLHRIIQKMTDSFN